MLSDVEMNNLSPVMANNKEAVQQVEGDRRDSEKIHGGDHFAMIAKKGLPAPGKSWILGRSLHPAGDASLGYIEAQQPPAATHRKAHQLCLRAREVEAELQRDGQTFD
jgi:hypothetical protein